MTDQHEALVARLQQVKASATQFLQSVTPLLSSVERSAVETPADVVSADAGE